MDNPAGTAAGHQSFRTDAKPCLDSAIQTSEAFCLETGLMDTYILYLLNIHYKLWLLIIKDYSLKMETDHPFLLIKMTKTLNFISFQLWKHHWAQVH